MKRIILPILCALFCVFSCKYDDTELRDSIRNHEQRIANLELLCSRMNTNISSLQIILEAVQSNDYVKAVVPIMENGKEVGYTITFSKSQPITIYQGKNGSDGRPGPAGNDGHSPVVGVKLDTDGLYYWTLDGEWLLDDNGNKIKAVGTDGEDGLRGENGVMPQLRIVEGYWEISYDNGVEWQRLGRATGDTGAPGENGDSTFQSVDVSNPAYILFILNDGTSIKVLKETGLMTVTIGQFDDYFLPNSTVSIPLQVENAQGDISIETIGENGWTADATVGADGKGTVEIHVPSVQSDGKIILFITDSRGIPSVKSLKFQGNVIDPDRKIIKKITANGKEFNMIKVFPGEFMMGGTGAEPVHKVTLTKSYFLAETEVTEELWNAVMGDGSSQSKKPVTSLTWVAANDFIVKLNQLTGQTFRLPTEAEWEFAARGGLKSHNYRFAGGDSAADFAWYSGNSPYWVFTISTAALPVYKTSDVKTKKPNELGLYDMSGNAIEWCSDYYAVYSNGDTIDPKGPETGTERVMRGGSCFSKSDKISVWCRWNYPETKTPSEGTYAMSWPHGFRLAL